MLAVLTLLKPYLSGILAWLVGWLMPSPWQLLARRNSAIQSAEDKASGPDPDTTELDHIP